jgi:hypothetical protein
VNLSALAVPTPASWRDAGSATRAFGVGLLLGVGAALAIGAAVVPDPGEAVAVGDAGVTLRVSETEPPQPETPKTASHKRGGASRIYATTFRSVALHTSWHDVSDQRWRRSPGHRARPHAGGLRCNRARADRQHLGCGFLGERQSDLSADGKPRYAAERAVASSLRADLCAARCARRKCRVFESNAQDGSIVRININPGPTFSFDVIAKGFPVNGGQPGSILGPSGLQYDDRHDRLYIVDGANNALYAVRHVSTIPAGGIVVHSTAFSGPFAKRARVVLSGSPLNGPISSLLLINGNLILGNTLDPTGQNLMLELTPHGKVLNVRNVDTGAAGALFGMVATGTTPGDTIVYFNDDNDNTVKSLTHRPGYVACLAPEKATDTPSNVPSPSLISMRSMRPSVKL